MGRLRTLLVSGLLFVAVNASAHAGVRDETICGWINMEGQYHIALTDAFDTYVLSNDVGAISGIEAIQIRQRGAQWMDRQAREARYCGCVGATFNGAELTKIYNFKQKRISACRNDPKLPQYQASSSVPAAPQPAAPPAPAPTYAAPAPAMPAPTYAAPAPAVPAPTYAAPAQQAPAAGTLLSGGYFRLTTMFRESAGECLEGNQLNGRARNGAAFMDRCQDVSGQLWKAIDQGNGYFRLTTMFRENESECLEGNQLNGGARNGAAFMDSCQNVSGQLWKATDQGNGYFRLTTMFRESAGECLEGNQFNGPARSGAAFMDACQNVSGQLWKAVPVR